jgi:hypothetical protein
MDMLPQRRDEQLVIQVVEAPSNISLDEPGGSSPLVVDFLQGGMTSSPWSNVAWQKNIVTFSLSCQATGIYQFSRLQQTQIKQEIAGKSTDEALRLLLHKEGAQTAFIDGVDKAATLPGNSNSITITVLHPLT